MTRQKPRERLEKTLARVAREQGLDQERLRRWVSFLALCGALDRAIHTGILAGYYLKGGVAMELRFAENARATKDLDVGMEGARADRLRSLTEALAAGFDDFTFRIKAQTRDMEQADTIRVQVAIQHRTRAWQTIEVDLGPANAGAVDLIEPRVRVPNSEFRWSRRSGARISPNRLRRSFTRAPDPPPRAERETYSTFS